MRAARAPHVTDIRSFVAKVVRELAARPLLEYPLDGPLSLGYLAHPATGGARGY